MSKEQVSTTEKDAVKRPSLPACFKGKLIKHAASLLTERMSELEDDYPKRFPKHVLREIERHNERLRVIAIDLRRIADAV